MRRLTRPVKNLLLSILFICIVFQVLLPITYLFRLTNYNRYHIVGIKNELPLDMIYIGGSAAFAYWQPLKAWHDMGFTSYLYATDSLRAESILPYIKEVRKTQDPKLFVIGVRSFQYWEESVVESGFRDSSDSMDWSWNRMQLILRYLSRHTFSQSYSIPDKVETVLSYFFDIIKYHTNFEALKNKENWLLIRNAGTADNKGWEWFYRYEPVPRPENFQTEVRAVLHKNCLKTLHELLQYCTEEDLRVLFVVCPYMITEREYAQYNSIKDEVECYGFPFINMNDCYDEIGLDFLEDFWNPGHVNCFGAVKYTDYLELYLKEQYNLPDHRGEEEYKMWNDDYERFLKEELVAKRKVRELKENYYEPDQSDEEPD